MPSAQRESLRATLARFPHHPTDAQFADLIAALVDSAADSSKPLMSIAATLRHRGSKLPPELFDRIRAAAEAVLVQRRSDSKEVAPAPLPIGEWLTVREASRYLGVTEPTLLDRLRSEAHRKRLGWPMWDGFRWWIAVAAVDPVRRADFLVRQPQDEPLPELLPATCRQLGPAGERTPVTAGPLSMHVDDGAPPSCHAPPQSTQPPT